MNVNEAIYLGLNTLRRNKLRTYLTILGILIGIASLVSLISAGRGSEIQTKKGIENLGTNTITIFRRRPPDRAPGERRGISRGLVMEDLEGLKKIPGIKEASPEIEIGSLVYSGNNESESRVIGVSPSYINLRNLVLSEGRFFSSDDAGKWLRLVVLGSNAARELFPGGNSLGKTVEINNHYFKVCGILSPKGQFGFIDFDQQVYIPDLTAIKRLTGNNQPFNRLVIQTETAGQAKTLVPVIEEYLLKKHQGVEDFRVRSQEEMIETLGQISRTFTTLLVAIAGISLLVGGIGVMNMMLISVRERYREIGLRKALGAKDRDVLYQFLIEAVVICLAGGICGIAFGILVAKIISLFGKWAFVIPPDSIFLPFFFSMVVGLFFGLYPARKASGLDPVDALRYE